MMNPIVVTTKLKKIDLFRCQACGHYYPESRMKGLIQTGY